jgi:hypothetical protein
MREQEHEASRTLVKSAPELWAECSDAASLARHLSGPFGEIRITRLEPETTVAWEGERVSGTVRLEPSGWGTRVTLTATPAAVPEPEPPPAREPPPAAPVRTGLFARLRARFKAEPVVEPPQPEPEPAEPEPASAELEDSVDPGAALSAALDSLGQAHHRPFSRA